MRCITTYLYLRVSQLDAAASYFEADVSAALGAKHLRWLPAPALVFGCFSQRALVPLVNTSGLCQNNDNVRRLPNGQRVE